MTFEKLLAKEKVVPVVSIDNEEQARGLATALLTGGVGVIEVTLRSEFALSALSLLKQEFPDLILLAGTVNSAEQFRHVADIGIDGVISPGITENLVKTAHELDLPYLPGVANASDVLLAMEFGLQELKLFPATVVGGVGALKALAGPFPDIKFCPTGGVSQANYQEFLQLDNVMCVGGSWLASSKDIAEQNWAKITANCQAL